MRKIISIVLGWWFWATNRNNLMAAERLQHCAECPYRKWAICGACTCVLQAKARIREEQCPKGRWPHYYDWYTDKVIHSKTGKEIK